MAGITGDQMFIWPAYVPAEVNIASARSHVWYAAQGSYHVSLYILHGHSCYIARYMMCSAYKAAVNF